MTAMKVALTVNDFLRRAEEVYPHRIAVVDEPDQPAESWGAFTYAEMAAKARAQAAALDALGIGVGERVAIVSHNSARLLTALFGVSGSGACSCRSTSASSPRRCSTSSSTAAPEC